MQPAPRPPTTRLLRYRFDSAAELRRHCRVVDGRVLLFFPDPHPPFVFGRTLLELAFDRTGQQVVVPALIHARVAGTESGLWLELRALSVVAGLQSALVGPRRGSRRLGVDVLAYARPEDGAVLACPLIDVSCTGARVWGLPSRATSPHASLALRVPGWPELSAHVVWAHGHEAGLAFTPESCEVAQVVFAGLETLWSAARSARHDAGCACLRGGETLDPPLPRTALLRAQELR